MLRVPAEELDKQRRRWEAKLQQERENRNVGTDSIEVSLQRCRLLTSELDLSEHAVNRGGSIIVSCSKVISGRV